MNDAQEVKDEGHSIGSTEILHDLQSQQSPAAPPAWKCIELTNLALHV
ncbi:MAG: hypothetical protein ACJ70T_08035 [Nitrososphaera sp.]